MLVFTSFSQSPWPAAHLGLLAGRRDAGGALAGVRRRRRHALGHPAAGHDPPRRPVPAPARGDRRAGAGTDAVAAGAWRRSAAAVTDAVLAVQRRRARRGGPSPCWCRGRRARRGATRRPGSGPPRPRSPPPGCPSSSPAPRPRPASSTRSCAPRARPDVRPLPAVDLPVFTALIARAAVALTNNSGGLHLADAVGTPVVVTYAGTERLGDVAPRAVPSALLQVPVPCSPCRQLALPVPPGVPRRRPERLAGPRLRLAAHTPVPTPDGTAPAPTSPRVRPPRRTDGRTTRTPRRSRDPGPVLRPAGPRSVSGPGRARRPGEPPRRPRGPRARARRRPARRLALRPRPGSAATAPCPSSSSSQSAAPAAAPRTPPPTSPPSARPVDLLAVFGDDAEAATLRTLLSDAGAPRVRDRAGPRPPPSSAG